MDGGQAEDQGLCGNLSQASKRKPGTKQVSLSFPPSEPPYQANQVQSEVLDNRLVGISRRSHQENASKKYKDPGQSARKGSVLKTSKALGVRQHKDAKLEPLSMKKAEAQVTRLLKKTRISDTDMEVDEALRMESM